MSWDLKESDLATFEALDGPTRVLVLRVLALDDGAFDDLAEHPNGPMLAHWLLRQSAFSEWRLENFEDAMGMDLGAA
ncbi:hypothetical protein KL953_08585 [Mycolicibacterium goodii]|uniref:hypothetical protein n=1 Tax=Mycolicibacterium goodii TaxID=134601 RepID=UPI001BDCFB7E|nr:hypothetical protein [Mycolicibacterium goodii]MBU8808951.1 hypothetical protein [Mycolicibacterium goodii]